MVGDSAGILSSIGIGQTSSGETRPSLAIAGARVKAMALPAAPSSRRFRFQGDGLMRTYLVVIDESQEARVALRFAARRAAKTGGAVEILAPVARPDFVNGARSSRRWRRRRCFASTR
jgi:hypothetical protein